MELEMDLDLYKCIEKDLRYIAEAIGSLIAGQKHANSIWKP